MSNLVTLLKVDPLWDIFELRAITTLQNRVEQQLFRLEGSKKSIDERSITGSVSSETVQRLRELEEMLLLHAYGDFEAKVFLKQSDERIHLD